MKTQAYLPIHCGPIQSLVPSIIGGLLALSVCAFGLASLAVMSSEPQLPTPAVVVPVATPAPLCFDHSREWVASHGAQQGCPTDPMAYSPAAAFRVHG